MSGCLGLAPTVAQVLHANGNTAGQEQGNAAINRNFRRVEGSARLRATAARLSDSHCSSGRFIATFIALNGSTKVRGFFGEASGEGGNFYLTGLFRSFSGRKIS